MSGGGGLLCWVFVLNVVLKCLFQFCNHLAEEERAGYFTLIVFLLNAVVWFSCSESFPQGWYETCVCGIS